MRQLLLWCAGLLVLACCGAALFVVSYRHRSLALLDEELALIDSASQPLTFPEVLAEYYAPLPPGENAAPLWREAYQLLEESGGNEPILTDDMSTSDWTELRSSLDRQERVLAKVLAAVERRSARFEVEASGGSVVSSPSYELIRHLTTFLARKTKLAVHDRDTGRAVTLLGAILRTKSHCAEPTSMGYAMKTSVGNIAHQLLGELLALDLEEEQLLTIDGLFNTPLEDVHAALVGERAIVHGHYRFLEEQAREGKLWSLLGVVERDLARYLRISRIYFEASGKPNSDRLPLLRKASDLTDEERWFDHLSPLSFLVYGSRMLVHSNLKHRAGHKTARVVIHCELHRTRSGGLPTKLPDWAIDPFDNKPIRVRTTSNGYVAYSVGLDGKDQHGDTDLDIAIEVKKKG